MKLSPKQKKWTRRLLILFLIRFVVGGILFYIIEYRFKDIIQIFVKKESRGLYAFDAANVEVSLWHKTIIVNDALLYCKDSLRPSSYYKVRIPEISITIQSWGDLIFHKKVSVDSLGIVSPAFEITQNTVQATRQISFQPSQFFDALQKLLVHLKVHSFNLQNGSFTFNNLKSKTPFICSGLNVAVKNFLRNDSISHRLLSSDDIDISLPRQHWHLPDGLHQVSFAALHFSGKDQYFQLDTFSLQTFTSANRNSISINADKLFFNSKGLSSIYETQKLLIDTLLCFHPVLNLQTPDKKKVKDSTKTTQSANHFFAGISFKYIDVLDGQVIMNDQNTNFPTYETQKTNIRIYNLTLPSKSVSKIAFDSVHLKLNNIQFVTADSMFQMVVNEFTLHRNDLLCKNVVYGPTYLNHKNKGLQFTASALHLKNINLDDLLREKINGSEAELYDPVITLHGDEQKSKRSDSTHSIANFYKSLHDLHDLITVKNFKIISGNMQYNLSGTHPLNMYMKDMNSEILLDHFLMSDSLIDIKRAMPKLAVREMTVQSPGLNVVVNNYHFDGLRRHNRADKFHVTLNNKTTIRGEKIYWEILDWDLYQREKKIQTDYLQIHQLTVDANEESKNETKVRKELPIMNIGRIDIDQLHFTKSSQENNTIDFEAKDICTDGNRSTKKNLTWQNAEGIFENINFKSKNTNVAIKKVNFNNQFESVAEEASAILNNSGYTKLQIPLLKLSSKIQSNDFSKLDINEFVMNDAVILIHKTDVHQMADKAFSVPLNLTAQSFTINNASVKYINEKEADTLTAEANINFKGSALQFIKSDDKLFEFDKAFINISDLKLNKNWHSIEMLASSIILEKGYVSRNKDDISFNTSVKFGWNGAALKIHRPNGTLFELEKLSGSLNDPSFSISNTMKLPWENFVNKTMVTSGKINFKGQATSLNARSLSWDPELRNLNIQSFDVIPNKSMEEVFKKKAWQSDYITIRGEELNINGIAFIRRPGDSLISIKKILLSNTDFTTTRDKQMPFKHGVEKPMPTKLINAIRLPFQIDSFVLQRSNITVHEISAATGKEGIIPLQDVNVCVRNISNRANEGDSLIIDADAMLYNNHITNFHYKESYADSLSAFTAHYSAAPMGLKEFSYITTPLAAVSVDKGTSDTLFAHFYGNKYAAIGEMNFYYKDLKVRLLNPLDSSRKEFILSLKNMLANTFIVNKKNSSNAIMYFERDREKFAFNFWIKTTLRGILSTTGIKSSKKYLKEYAEKQNAYSLPIFKN